MALRDVRSAIDRLISQAPGTVGLLIRDLASGAQLEWAPAERFPAASIIKIPVLVEALRQVQDGALRLDDRIAVPAAAKVGGFGILKELESVGDLSLRDLLTLMIVISDNTAANLCIDRVGMDRVNGLLASLGLDGTILQRKMMDMEARRRGLDNFTTPGDTARLLELLATHRILTPALCDTAIDILSRQQVRDRLPLWLPAEMRVAHKTGELPEVRHDAGIIFSPNGEVVAGVLRQVGQVHHRIGVVTGAGGLAGKLAAAHAVVHRGLDRFVGGELHLGTGGSNIQHGHAADGRRLAIDGGGRHHRHVVTAVTVVGVDVRNRNGVAVRDQQHAGAVDGAGGNAAAELSRIRPGLDQDGLLDADLGS